MIDSKDISVVVQGAVDKEETPKCLNSIRKYLPDAEIILSTWEGTDVSNLDYDILVFNKDPGAYYCNRQKTIKNNLNRQIISTKNGLKNVSRKYALKLRSDLILTNNSFLNYYDFFPKRNTKYIIFKNRIMVSCLYSRESIYDIYTKKICKAHMFVSDWWFFGLKEDINLFFDVKLVDEPQFSQYYLNDNNYKGDYIWKYAPEGYFAQHLMKISNTTLIMNDLLSKYLLSSNFIFLGFRESGIYNKKHLPYSKDERLFDYIQYPGLITYYKFLKYYKNYIDKKYSIPKEVYKYYKLKYIHKKHSSFEKKIRKLISCFIPYKKLRKEMRGEITLNMPEIGATVERERERERERVIALKIHREILKKVA